MMAFSTALSRLTALRPRHYLGGIAVLSLIFALYGASLNAVLTSGESILWQEWWQDPYFHQVLLFSLGQAFLSASLSIVIGLLFARAFFYQSFRGKTFLLRLFSVTFVLPSLVAVFGILGIYGASGWLAKLCAYWQWDWRPNIYGLTGILIAHLFFNIPLAARMFLQSFYAIPNQQRQLAAQLNIRGWQFIRWLELPYLRQQLLPSFVLIFMLCFTSFAIVLVLGGGPKFTTIEVAIYQAIIFDFDLSKAAFFALLQCVFCLTLFALSAIFSKLPETHLDFHALWLPKQSSAVKYWQFFCLMVVSIFILLPLCNVIVNAISADSFLTAWQNPQLWQAMGYSFTIAPLSALVSVVFATALLQFSRQLHWLYFPHLAHGLVNSSMIVLSIPMLVLAIGLYVLLQDIHFNRWHLFGVLVFCNALSALPFVVRILAVPMNQNMQYYEKLCQSLGMQGWSRFRLIEWHNLAKPMQYAFALACALSLGDFTAIALFGNQDFSSLPYLLYQQLGSYRGDEAAVTAFILMLVCLGLFFMVEKQRD
ncbi:thiamine/thiamine pyrophosphate ABC transporter permease ThiP [Actinobacillus porcinus]|uniref:thiamine/thiamine pyrophosphate ABC transporter permease ThiP n=1 Tax=Actinobacillus porcinus TaxID=51048 RepID=UPI0023F37A1D|nr:thiamine/thiamine pyrophosphate ABC transporter permease ThiP [Actinobacillus porcinus]MDD7544333.1 thiamine/thiamine pyrophosphate ABC transporter permease ThiP [Actinobacillus porcinus]MDY5848672.1 thiamine/thiamine pyrophosphate ABC transporter permease ThiP [Actinobacillus porcinus]